MAAADRVGVDSLAGEQPAARPSGSVEQGEQQVGRADLGVAGRVGLVLGVDHDVAGPRR